MDNKHEEFKNKISCETYEMLETMYRVINVENKNNIDMNTLSKLNEILPKKDLQVWDRTMKISISYIRHCNIIQSLLEEYPNGTEDEKKIIDYYINSNELREMKKLGVGHYYNVKYKKCIETLYSVGYGKDSNWIDWLKKQNVVENNIKENGIQLIFKACNKHMNRGGEVRLKSLSKCFGVDLFKYMRLDQNKNANIYIIKDAPVNFIKIDQIEQSLQEYIFLGANFDIDKNPQFCLDFSNVRNGEFENYNKWSKEFLKNSAYISEAEFNKKKAEYGIQNELLESMLFYSMKQEHIQDGDKAISSRISPIADKEVIASDTFWLIKEYHTELPMRGIKTGVCYHFSFSCEEYCQLIYSYFKEYAKRKMEIEGEYKSRIESWLGNLEEVILQLKEEQKKLKQEVREYEKLDREHIKKEEQRLQSNIEFCDEFIEFLDKVKRMDISEESTKKIQDVLQFVEWEKEEIPKHWSFNNIYHSKCNGNENVFVNIYKCICKSTAFMEGKYGK